MDTNQYDSDCCSKEVTKLPKDAGSGYPGKNYFGDHNAAYDNKTHS